MASGDNAPRRALIYLHGHASSAEQVPAEFREPRDDGWVRICPTGPIATPDGYAWFTTGPRGVDAPSLHLAVHAVNQVVRGLTVDLGVDPEAVYVGGFSQGAATALALAVTRGREGCAALGGLVLHAGFLPELLDDELDPAEAAVRDVLVVHPDDDEVVPAFLAKDLVASLERSPEVRTVRFESVVGGHAVGREMVDLTLAWLDGERRGGDRPAA